MALTQIKDASAKAIQTGFSSGVLKIGNVEIGIRQTENGDNTGNINYVPDESGKDSYALVSNNGKRINVECVIYEGVTPPKKGELVTLNDESYIVETSSPRHTVDALRLTLTIYKPDGTNWEAVPPAP